MQKKVLAQVKIVKKVEIVYVTTSKLQLPGVESRTQGSRPRPTTQKKSEAKAKDRNARGQGQGPRTQMQVFS